MALYRQNNPERKPALVFLVNAEEPLHAVHATVHDTYVYIIEPEKGDDAEETRRYIPWHMIEEVVRGEACEVHEA